MKDERLYIDGKLADIDGSTKITMGIKSNLFRDVSQIASNSTYTVKLPKTARNIMILRHTDSVTVRDNYPYTMHSVRYFRNGVEVIRDGRLTVLKVSENAIEVCIVWGLYPNFSKLISDGTTLNQLKSSDRILYEEYNSVDTYEQALKADYFYAKYDVLTHEQKKDYTWKSGSMMIYPMKIDNPSEYANSIGGHRFGWDDSTNNHIKNLHPVVKASFVLSLIKEQTGIDFSFSGDAKEYIDTLIIPLINKKSNELTFEGQFRGRLEPINKQGTVSVQVMESGGVFAETAGNIVQVLNVKTTASIILDIKAEWQFDITGMRPTGHSTYMSNGKSGSYDDYSIRYLDYLKMTVTNGLQNTEYIIGNKSGMIKTPADYKGICRFEYSGYGKIEVKAGNTVKIEWTSDSPSGFLRKRGLKSERFLGGTIKVVLSEDDNVPNGGYFPIAYNLPKIKIVDFVKFLAAITGTFPMQMAKDSTVKFEPVSTLWNNRAKAKDWTNRLIAYGNGNKPKEIDFKMSGYAQRNLYKWKDDDTVTGSYDGVITINNETLEMEKTLYEFPFAATDGNNVPMYTPKDTSGFGTNGHFGNGRENGGENGEQPRADNKPSYKACKDRILRLFQDDMGKAVAFFDIDMQQIINEKYRNIEECLRNTKIITEQIHMRDLELIEFDETIPIYLSQYGSYFSILEIKTEDHGIAEVTMLQIFKN